MANYTINNIPNVVTEVSDSDILPVWDSGSALTGRTTRGNLLGISKNQVIAISGTTVTGAKLETNAILRLYFTAEVTGSNDTTPMAISYNGTSYTVKVAKNGSLTNFVAYEISSGTFKYLQAYTTLELLYDGTQFIIVGNPIVLSSSDYTIYADGSKRSGFVVGGVSNSGWDWTSQFSVPEETTENASFTIPVDGLYAIKLGINAQNTGIETHNLFLLINGWEFAKVGTANTFNENNSAITLRLKQGTVLNFTHYKSTTPHASGVTVGNAIVNLFRVNEIF